MPDGVVLNTPVLDRGGEEGALLGFFLAQRCGSSALLRWVQGQLGAERVYDYRNVDPFIHWNRQVAGTLDGYAVYSGFSDFRPPKDLRRPFCAFSTVRHPLHRLASLYAMSQRDQLHVYHDLAVRSSFGEYYREGSADRPYYFQNLCCRRIGGRPSFEAALEAMDEYFGIVAVTDALPVMTALLISAYGWDTDPLPTPDDTSDERYASEVPADLRERILEDNAEDLRLFDHVMARAVDVPGPDVAATGTGNPDHPGPCPICGDPLETLDDGGYCPTCRAPARARSLPALLERTIVPQVRAAGVVDLPLLTFAATGAEKGVLARTFPQLRSVSLFGDYGDDHETGVDVRDLSRYSDASFSGMFGILLFDYFPEHESALRETARVLAPGGVLFMLILTSRVLPGDGPPEVTRRIEPRAGYFDYIPEGGELLNVTVGQDWLLEAIARAGLHPQQVRLRDPWTRESLEWFVGQKPLGDRPAPAPPRPARRIAEAETEAVTRSYTRDVDPAFGFRRVSVQLTIPAVPASARGASFAEHVAGSRAVTAVLPGGVLVSEDLGETWEHHRLDDADGLDFVNCLTTAEGEHLLQVKSAPDERSDDGMGGGIHRYDAGWTPLGSARPGRFHWHGSRSAGEAGGTILWAEYPDNKTKYEAGNEALAVDPAVHRSRDGGASWEKVFEQPGAAIRHFHTVVADPCRAGQWWLSSGDRPQESRVWVSTDDGSTWADVTNSAPDVELHPSFAAQGQAIQRYTDLWLGDDELIWGADDWLGGPAAVNDLSVSARAGARMYRSPRTSPLKPADAGWIGNPVRSIVDVGPALLVTTEAKRSVLTSPQVYLMSKEPGGPLQEILTVDVAGGGGSGLTFSRASRAAEQGTFFSFRSSRDLVQSPTRILRWAIDFA